MGIEYSAGWPSTVAEAASLMVIVTGFVVAFLAMHVVYRRHGRIADCLFSNDQEAWQREGRPPGRVNAPPRRPLSLYDPVADVKRWAARTPDWARGNIEAMNLITAVRRAYNVLLVGAALAFSGIVTGWILALAK